MSNTTLRRKLVIIGDSCGKTSLLHVFTLGSFPTQYQPTVFENYVTDCRVDGIDIQLSLWDTAGQEEYERLRPLSYSKADVIIIAFAVDDKQSLYNTRTKWIQECVRYVPTCPILLVGLKQEPQSLSRHQFTGTVLGDGCQETFLLPKGQQLWGLTVKFPVPGSSLHLLCHQSSVATKPRKPLNNLK